MNTVQFDLGKWTEEWLKRQELYAGRGGPKSINTRDVVFVLNTDPHPHIRRPSDLIVEFGQAGRTLCQHLKPMPRCLSHHVEDPQNEIRGNVFVNKSLIEFTKIICGFFQCRGNSRTCSCIVKLEAIAIVSLPHCLEAQRLRSA